MAGKASDGKDYGAHGALIRKSGALSLADCWPPSLGGRLREDEAFIEILLKLQSQEKSDQLAKLFSPIGNRKPARPIL